MKTRKFSQLVRYKRGKGILICGCGCSYFLEEVKDSNWVEYTCIRCNNIQCFKRILPKHNILNYEGVIFNLCELIKVITARHGIGQKITDDEKEALSVSVERLELLYDHEEN